MDPTFSQTANATGGQAYRLRSGEIEKAAPLMLGQQAHDEEVFFANGQLGRAGTREFEFWADSTIQSMWISIVIECKVDIGITRPGGIGVPAQDAGTGFTNVHASALRALTVVRPAAGGWRLLLRGGGEYSVSVRAKTALTFEGLQFVRRGGRPGHEGWFPIEGLPSTREQMARAKVYGDFQELDFLFMNEAGDMLQRFELERDGKGPDFYGRVTLPAQRYRVGVVGRNVQGQAFQRIDARLHEPPGSKRQ